MTRTRSKLRERVGCVTPTSFLGKRNALSPRRRQAVALLVAMGVLTFSTACSLAFNGTKTVKQLIEIEPNLNLTYLWGLGSWNIGTGSFRRETMEIYQREDEKPPRNRFSRWWSPPSDLPSAPRTADGAWRPFGRSSSTRCECISSWGPTVHVGPLRPGDVHGEVVRLGANVEFMNGDVFAHTEQLNTIVSQSTYTRRVVRKVGRTTAEAVDKMTEEVAALSHQMRWMSKRQTAAAKAARKTETDCSTAAAKAARKTEADCSADAKAATRAADVRLGAVLLLIAGMFILIVGMFIRLEHRISTMAGCSADAKAATRATDVRLGAILLLIVGMFIWLEHRISTMAGCVSPTRSSPGSFPRRQRRPPARHCSRENPRRRLEFLG